MTTTTTTGTEIARHEALRAPVRAVKAGAADHLSA